MIRFFINFLLLVIPFSLFSQNGTIIGRLTETQDGKQVPLPFANVFLEGTNYGSTSDFDGNFRFIAPAGDYKLMCSFLGYETFKRSIVLTPGSSLEVIIDMKPEGIAIEGVDVVAKVNRESEMALVMEQKNASVSIESIGARQLSLQGAGDAVSGVTKVTGITKQSGSYTINVRGLGDRYNSTTMNGLPLPSNHAEFKNINLELFSADVIGVIGVEKVFIPNLYGDVSGANINIVSKRHTGDSYFKIEINSGVNSSVIGANEFYLQDGPDYFGFSIYNEPSGEYIPDDYSVFKNSWVPVKTNIKPNIGLALKGGHSLKFNNGNTLSLFVTGSFDNEMKYNDRKDGRYESDGTPDKLFENGKYYKYETQTGGLINLNYTTPTFDMYYNSYLLNSSDESVIETNGNIQDINDPATEKTLLRESAFERNILIVNQLLGNHKPSENTNLNWGVSYNKVNNILPDRRHNIFVYNIENTTYKPSTNDDANNNRYWHHLVEDEIAGNISFDIGLGESLNDEITNRAKLSFGYSGRWKQRSFEAYQYNHKIKDENVLIDPWKVNDFFNNDNLQANVFGLKTFFNTLNLANIYDGSQLVNSGFAMIEYHINPKLLLVGGARIENVYQKVTYRTTIKTGENDFTELKFLPSVSIRYKTTVSSNLRFAVSKTYTLPQFKEVAPFQFEGITNSSVGNPYLYPSTNYNADIKWEVFPKNGELYSITGFGKYILNPINYFVMSSAANDFTYANAGDWAYVIGGEFEVRKNLFYLINENKSKKLSTISNLSLMISEQQLNNDKVRNETDGKYISSFNNTFDDLQGAAPIIGNVGLMYQSENKNKERSFSASLIYNYTSKRLYLLGFANSIGNQIDMPENRLDFVLKASIKKIEFSLSAKNLFDQAIERVQDNATNTPTVLYYKEGVSLKFGISYEF